MSDNNHLASRKLCASLSEIAETLKETESARGRWVRKERSDGYDLEWEPDPPDEMGLNAVTFINVEVDVWRELGSILERVAKGENARRLFRQHLRTNSAKHGEHRLRALAYSSARARNPEADDEEALEFARKIVPKSRRLTRDTLRKYAQRHRARCLCLLAFHPNWAFRFETSDIEIRALGPGIKPLVEHLRKKESRDSWRKPLPFRTPADVLVVKTKGKQESEPAFPGISLHAEELPPGASLRLEKRDAILEQVQVTSIAKADQE